MNKILFATLMLSGGALAGQDSFNPDDWGDANANCAAFYMASQVLIKQEVKNEYSKKSASHHALSTQMYSSPQKSTDSVNKHLREHAIKAASLKENEKITSYLSENSISCSSVEGHSLAIIKNHTPPESRE